MSTCYGSLLVTSCMLKQGSTIVQLWWWKTTPPWSLLQLPTNHRSQQTTAINIRSTLPGTRRLLSSGLRWFPREIDCPKRVAPEPHTIVLWHLIHEFRLIVCTSYTNSSCCTLLYSFILWFCFIRLHKLLLCLFLVYTLSAIRYYLEYTPHHNKHTESWRSTPSGSTQINSYRTHPWNNLVYTSFFTNC